MTKPLLMAASLGLATLAGVPRAALADTPGPERPTVEDIYAALLEPSLADDGQISDRERDAIIAAARRLLNEQQVEQITQRIDALSRTSERHERPTARPVEDRASIAGRTADSPTGSPTPHPTVGLYFSVRDCDPTDDSLAATCESGRTGLFDNLYLTGTLDGFKSPVDFGLNGHFSFNMAANWGYPLVEELGIGVQLGSSVNFSSFLVPSFKSATGLDDRFQNFTTVGIFQRTECGVNWAAAYDFLFDDYYLNMEIGQWRGQIGFEITPCDEIGVWAATGDHGDSGPVDFPFFTGRVHWEPITQGNAYWRHTWSNGADTSWWFGIAETESDFVFGGEFRVPLSDRLALIGAANFLVAPADGSTTASTGLAFYPAGGARHAGHSRFAPMLPVANNGTLVIDRF